MKNENISVSQIAGLLESLYTIETIYMYGFKSYVAYAKNLKNEGKYNVISKLIDSSNN